MSAKELYQSVHEMQKELRKQYIENKPPKNNMLSDHLDAESLAFLEALRRTK